MKPTKGSRVGMRDMHACMHACTVEGESSSEQQTLNVKNPGILKDLKLMSKEDIRR